MSVITNLVACRWFVEQKIYALKWCDDSHREGELVTHNTQSRNYHLSLPYPTILIFIIFSVHPRISDLLLALTATIILQIRMIWARFPKWCYASMSDNTSICIGYNRCICMALLLALINTGIISAWRYIVQVKPFSLLPYNIYTQALEHVLVMNQLPIINQSKVYLRLNLQLLTLSSPTYVSIHIVQNICVFHK